MIIPGGWVIQFAPLQAVVAALELFYINNGPLVASPLVVPPV